MKIHEVDQRSIAWSTLHIGKVTASELDNLLTPEFAPRKGETRNTYLFKKAAEVFRGQPLCMLSPAAFQSAQMEQGLMIEDEVIPWFELEHNAAIRRVGFCESDDGLSGCSPDGLLEDGGIEIKAPEPQTHVRYRIGGVVPKDYIAQVHHSMYVTGAPWWKFLSYRRKFPPLIVHVLRDEEIIGKIDAAVKQFATDLTNVVSTLRAMK